ncbi:MAG: Fur family transcriptional regulator [Dehalococcoidia bacterium]
MTAQILRRYGLRLTRQRETIVKALRHAEGHRTAQAILDEVQARHPNVNASTIYRTLTTFCRLGLVTETDLGTGELSYAWLGSERHHHLVCHRCDRVIELDHRYLEPLQRRLLSDYRFDATVDHFAIFGVCETCRDRATD